MDGAPRKFVDVTLRSYSPSGVPYLEDRTFLCRSCKCEDGWLVLEDGISRQQMYTTSAESSLSQLARCRVHIRLDRVDRWSETVTDD